MRYRLLKKKCVFLIVIILLFCVSFVGCDKEEDPAGISLNVMSFNIRNDTFIDSGNKDWSVRKDLVIKYIEEKAADVVCLQEVKTNQATDLEAGLEGYTIVYYNRGDGEGSAILFNDKFDLIQKNVFWLSETPEEQSKGWGASYYRICVNITLKIKENDKQINVFDAHLDHIKTVARTEGVKLIMSRVEDANLPSIVCGDFNTDNTSECYEVIANKMQDCQVVAKTSDSGLTFQNYGDLSLVSYQTPIDFCFVSNDVFYVKQYDILQETTTINVEGQDEVVYYSDHYAIINRIILKNES